MGEQCYREELTFIENLLSSWHFICNSNSSQHVYSESKHQWDFKKFHVSYIAGSHSKSVIWVHLLLSFHWWKTWWGAVKLDDLSQSCAAGEWQSTIWARLSGFRSFPGGTSGKEPICNAGDVRDVGSILGQEDPLEQVMATHSRILAWRSHGPWNLESVGLQRVGHNWSDFAHLVSESLGFQH